MRASEVVPKIKRGLSRGLEDLGDLMQDKAMQIVQGNSFDLGELHGSFKVVKVDDFNWILLNDAGHAWFVESGTKAHRPPFQPIFEWTYRKGPKPRPGQTVENVAWAIVMKITNEGTEPKPYMRPTAVWGKMHAHRVIINRVNLELI